MSASTLAARDRLFHLWDLNGDLGAFPSVETNTLSWFGPDVDLRGFEPLHVDALEEENETDDLTSLEPVVLGALAGTAPQSRLNSEIGHRGEAKTLSFFEPAKFFEPVKLSALADTSGTDFAAVTPHAPHIQPLGVPEHAPQAMEDASEFVGPHISECGCNCCLNNRDESELDDEQALAMMAQAEELNAKANDPVDEDGLVALDGLEGTALTGRVFVDLNKNNVDDEKAGARGYKVKLLDETGETVATTKTKWDGSYAFSGIEAGEYRVAYEIKHSGLKFAKAEQGSDRAVDSDAVTMSEDGMVGTTHLHHRQGWRDHQGH